MSNNGQFQKGSDQRRSPGRPKGAKNKLKIDDAIKSLDDLTPKAVQKLEAILDAKIKGTTPVQILNAAKLIIELSLKEREREEESPTLSKSDSDGADDGAPLISLKAQ
jgi:hypothetical protein